MTKPFHVLGNDARSLKLEHNGRVQSMRAWAREIGISHCALKHRLTQWRNTSLARTAPAGTHGKKKS